MNLLVALLTAVPGAPQDAAPARIVLEALDGSVRERDADLAALTDLGAEGAAFAHYLGVREPGPPPGTLDERVVVYLHNGDRVWGRVGGGAGESLELVLHGGARLELALDEIASLLFPRRLPTDGTVEPEAAGEGDRLYLRRGRGLDKIDGLIQAFDGGVAFEGRFGQRTHAWEEIAALFIEDVGEGEPEDAATALVTVDLPDGGRLTGRLVSMGTDGVRLEHDGHEVLLPPAIVRELARADGSFLFLSQVPVADPGPITLFGGTDDLGMVYPHRLDRNCMNGPLRSGGRSWSRGLGVHAPSRLTWHLDGAWKELRALVAIDDSVLRGEHHGSVVFRVLVDGEARWESPVLVGGDPPLALPAVDLAGGGRAGARGRHRRRGVRVRPRQLAAGHLGARLSGPELAGLPVATRA